MTAYGDDVYVSTVADKSTVSFWYDQGTTGNWEHIVNSSGQYYVNGQLATPSEYPIYITGSEVYIGRTSYSNYVDGVIDDFKIYSTSLTPDQILTEYNAGKAIVLGSTSTSGDGVTADNSSAREYCVPGDTSTCSAPVGEWKFDEGTGTTSTYDTSGSGYTGTMNGTMTTSDWSPGKFGSALDFDGTDDSVSYTRFVLAAGLSFSAWIKTTSADATASYAGNAAQNVIGDTTGGVYLGFGVHGGKVRYNHYYTSWSNFTGNITVNDGVWHYITVTHDQATGNYAIYVDGILDLSGTTTYKTNAGVDVIARGYSSDYFTGTIDQVRIYNYARTPAQVAWEYNQGAPIAQYKFDECQGTVAYNSAPTENDSPAGNNGTITIGGSGSNTSAGICTGAAGEAWKDGATGKFNASLEFDGTDDWVNLSGNGDYVDGTLAFWFKKSDLNGGVQYLLDGRDATDTGNWWILQDYVSGSCTDATGNVCFFGKVEIPRSLMANNTWQHVVVTMTISDSKIYLNGNLVNTGTTVDADFRFLRAGTRYTGASWLNGQMDDILVYNYALTPTQVKTVYNYGSVSFK
ncbi:LamG domain-containing protein [bacterium]|nr:LamG domain-containing protein [bacterium]